LRFNEPKKIDARSAAEAHWYFIITLTEQLDEYVIVCTVKNERKRLRAELTLHNLNRLSQEKK
jgi:hypothetical protein